MSNHVVVLRFDGEGGRPVVRPGSTGRIVLTDAWLQYLVDTVWDAAQEQLQDIVDGDAQEEEVE